MRQRVKLLIILFFISCSQVLKAEGTITCRLASIVQDKQYIHTSYVIIDFYREMNSTKNPDSFLNSTKFKSKRFIYTSEFSDQDFIQLIDHLIKIGECHQFEPT